MHTEQACVITEVMVTKRELVQAVLDGKTVYSGGRYYRFDEEKGFVFRYALLAGEWASAAWHLGLPHNYYVVTAEEKPLTLREAIQNPGSGARMRQSLKVLAAEWRQRGGLPHEDLVAAAETLPCFDGDRVSGRIRDDLHRRLVANMPKSLFQKQLVKLGACPDGLAFAGLFSTAREAWEACENDTWMWWLVYKYDPNIGDVVRYEYNCARIRQVVPFERLRELSRGK